MRVAAIAMRDERESADQLAPPCAARARKYGSIELGAGPWPVAKEARAPCTFT
jgi:hypothetical protein